MERTLAIIKPDAVKINVIGEIIAMMQRLIREECITYEVYKPWWIFSRAIGYFDPAEPFTIHVNFYKLRKMSVHNVVANIVHEFVHVADHQDDKHYFGHGSNYRKGKENTAPYWIGNLAYELSQKHFG